MIELLVESILKAREPKTNVLLTFYFFSFYAHEYDMRDQTFIDDTKMCVWSPGAQVGIYPY